MIIYGNVFFFFNDTATTEIYTLSLHDALPICRAPDHRQHHAEAGAGRAHADPEVEELVRFRRRRDRKSTRLNSSHVRTARMPSSA